MNVEEESLASTPSWAVAAVCSVFILIALLIEHALHLLTHHVRKRKRKTLNQAVYQIKAELRNFGFMSLLLTIAEQPISKICITRSMADTLLPCKDAGREDAPEGFGYCGEKGKVPLVSPEDTQQLQRLIIVFAIFHIFGCLLTLALGEAKMKRWKSWEEETKTLDYQLSHDPRRFKLASQTSFGKRHLKIWRNQYLLMWLGCFMRQFSDSISKSDYFALRHGFIQVHLAKDNEFDFWKFMQRSLDKDFLKVVRISPCIWIYVLMSILFSAHRFYSHYWLPFIPLLTLLIIGAKLQFVVNNMCLRSSEGVVVQGMICVMPENDFFWLQQPQAIVHIIQFILIQNSFQLAFFTWSLYEFGFQSCFHGGKVDIVLNIGISILVQFLCAYMTLPIYTLVTQMGSTMKETVFTEHVVNGLKNWHNRAKINLSTKSSSPAQILEYFKNQTSSSNACTSRTTEFQYPSGRLELLEIQKVVEEIITGNGSSAMSNNEFSFRLWQKKKANLQLGSNN